MNTIEQIELNDQLWDNAIKSGNKTDMEKYCHIVIKLKKSIYPVLITVEHERDYMGHETGKTYLLVDWSRISGWYDSEIFHKVVGIRYEPNDKGKETGVNFSRGGGSAVLEFNTGAKDIVIKELQKAGYLVEMA